MTELGAVVCEALKKEGIDAFLTGGAFVSIYTQNKYQSFDLDFVAIEDRKKIKRCMEKIGFKQDKSRYFIHPNSPYFVEFPGSAVMVGDELIHEFAEINTQKGTLKLLTPTDCVKDRLSAFYHWNDRQGLEQAVWVAKAYPVDLQNVEEWSQKERMTSKFDEFKKSLASS